MSVQVDKFTYDDAIVRSFVVATLFWGVIAMAVGILIALQLADPRFNFEIAWLSFGRLRPLHTNAAIFAFASSLSFCVEDGGAGGGGASTRLLLAAPAWLATMPTMAVTSLA